MARPCAVCHGCGVSVIPREIYPVALNACLQAGSANQEAGRKASAEAASSNKAAQPMPFGIGTEGPHPRIRSPAIAYSAASTGRGGASAIKAGTNTKIKATNCATAERTFTLTGLLNSDSDSNGGRMRKSGAKAKNKFPDSESGYPKKGSFSSVKKCTILGKLR